MAQVVSSKKHDLAFVTLKIIVSQTKDDKDDVGVSIKLETYIK